MELEIPGFGKLRGKKSGDIVEFLNVPYATLAHRFAKPQLANNVGELNCTRQGPLCPQTTPFDDNYNGVPEDQCAPLDLRYDELNCLNLRITAPLTALDPNNSPVPVVVWLHGGSNIAGTPYRGSSDASQWISSSLKAKRSFVLVTPHYRVGAFGWLPHPNHGSNLGLWDQQAALEWVHKFGPFFGADTTKLTLSGQSAGATDAWAHTQRPQALKLVHQFCLLSGSYFLFSKKDCEALRAKLVKEVGEDLETAEASKIVSAQKKLGIIAFGPMVDEEDGLEGVEGVYKADLTGKRVIFGDCEGDGDYMGGPEHTKAMFTDLANLAMHKCAQAGAVARRQLCDATNPFDLDLRSNHMVELHYIINGYPTDKFNAAIAAVQDMWTKIVNFEELWGPDEAYYMPPEGLQPRVCKLKGTRGDSQGGVDLKMMELFRGWPINGFNGPRPKYMELT